MTNVVLFVLGAVSVEVVEGSMLSEEGATLVVSASSAMVSVVSSVVVSVVASISSKFSSSSSAEMALIYNKRSALIVGCLCGVTNYCKTRSRRCELNKCFNIRAKKSHCYALKTGNKRYLLCFQFFQLSFVEPLRWFYCGLIGAGGICAAGGRGFFGFFGFVVGVRVFVGFAGFFGVVGASVC